MKSLQEYSHSLLTGKQLIEKLVISKNSPKGVISIPYVDFNTETVMLNKEFMSLSLPDHKYFIYHDKYRSNLAHFGNKDELVFNIIMDQYDYEDFDEQEDILYSSDDLKDIIGWYINKYLGLDLPKPKEHADEWLDRINHSKAKRHYDNLYTLCQLYTGDDDYSSAPESFDNNYDLKNLVDKFAGEMGYDIVSEWES